MKPIKVCSYDINPFCLNCEHTKGVPEENRTCKLISVVPLEDFNELKKQIDYLQKDNARLFFENKTLKNKIMGITIK